MKTLLDILRPLSQFDICASALVIFGLRILALS